MLSQSRRKTAQYAGRKEKRFENALSYVKIAIYVETYNQ